VMDTSATSAIGFDRPRLVEAMPRRRRWGSPVTASRRSNLDELNLSCQYATVQAALSQKDVAPGTRGRCATHCFSTGHTTTHIYMGWYRAISHPCNHP